MKLAVNTGEKLTPKVRTRVPTYIIDAGLDGKRYCDKLHAAFSKVLRGEALDSTDPELEEFETMSAMIDSINDTANNLEMMVAVAVTAKG